MKNDKDDAVRCQSLASQLARGQRAITSDIGARARHAQPRGDKGIGVVTNQHITWQPRDDAAKHRPFMDHLAREHPRIDRRDRTEAVAEPER